MTKRFVIIDNAGDVIFAHRNVPESYEAVVAEAAETILGVMEEGQRSKHLPRLWQTESEAHHLTHAETHLVDYRRYGRVSDLESAMCRVVMASYVRRHPLQ